MARYLMNKKQLNDCQKLINQLKLIYKKQEWQYFIDVDTKLQTILEKISPQKLSQEEKNMLRYLEIEYNKILDCMRRKKEELHQKIQKHQEQKEGILAYKMNQE